MDREKEIVKRTIDVLVLEHVQYALLETLRLVTPPMAANRARLYL